MRATVFHDRETPAVKDHQQLESTGGHDGALPLREQGNRS
jgi:hypothetical protein